MRGLSFPLVLTCFAIQLPAVARGAEAGSNPLAAEDARMRLDPEPEEWHTRLDPGLRLRFGASLVLGTTLADEWATSDMLRWLLGLDLRLGVQINDLLAVMWQGVVAFTEVRGAALFEVTPVRYFSVGAGVGFQHWPSASPSGRDEDAVILPIRVAVNAPLSEYATSNRTALSIELNLVPSSVYTGAPTASGQRFDFGAFLGLGFELY